MERTLTYPEATIDNISTTFQQKKVSMVKWADSGRKLYASSPGDHCDGVMFWDSETGQVISTFEHRKINKAVCITNKVT